MNDTSSEITRKMSEMIQAKPPEERLKMGCSMHATSKYLIRRAILEKNPGISPNRLKQEIFLRFYGDEINPIQRDKILKHFESLPRPPKAPA